MQIYLNSSDLVKILAENGAGCDAFHFADLVKNGSEWKFVAVGNGCNGSVDKLRKKYL